MQTISPSLTSDERQIFSACEKIISAGLKTFSEVGNALLHIRNNQLYREGFTSFERYCREKWAMSDRRAHQLCAAAEVVNNIQGLNPGSVIPECERHARPLVGLKPEEQAAAFHKAQEVAATESRAVQAKDVEEAVDKIKPKTLDNQFANAMGFETVEDLTHPRMAKEDAVNLAKGKITEAIDFTHTLMTRAYSESEKTWILNHIEAALRHAKHDLEKHRKFPLAAA